MPAYPCAKCGTQVDVRDVVCRGCNDKKPFTCSKCNKRLSQLEIFQADQITFQKPLFCVPCGKEGQPRTCPHCKTNVFVHDAVDDEGVLYHRDCYKTVALQKKITPILRVVLMIFIGWAAYGFTVNNGTMVGVGGAAFGAIAGFLLGGLMAPRRL